MLWHTLEKLGQDLRFAWRLILRSPAFTALAVITIGVGIGATTAILSLVDVVFLQKLPVTHADRLVVLDAITPRGDRNNLSYPLFEQLRDGAGAFDGVLAALDGVNNVSLRGPEPAAVEETSTLQLVSGEYFDVLGAAPLVGRTFTPQDNRYPGGHPVAVLSFALWKRRFASDPGVIGKSIVLNEQALTVIGVMRAGFFGEAVGRAPEIWVPLMMQPAFDHGSSVLNQPNVGWLRLMARLRPGVTREQAATALSLRIARLRAEQTDIAKTVRYLARIELTDGSRGLAGFRERYSLSLRILAGVVGILLLIACANVSGLLLARGAGRQREVAVRLALGAGRPRLIRQFLTESLLLASLGGLLGLLCAWWGSGLLLLLASNDADPIRIDVTPNLRTLVITAVLSLATVMAIGLAPALSASRSAINSSLKLMTGKRAMARLSPVLVIAQISLTLMLLTGAALFVQTLHNLRTLDVGYASSKLLHVNVRPAVSAYKPEAIPQLMQQLVQRVSALPGVAAVSQSQAGFGTGISRTCCIAVEGYAHSPGEDRQVETLGITPGYFQSLRLPLLRGRDFTPEEVASDPRAPSSAVIVNEAFAKKYYGGQDPLGRHFGWGDPPAVTYGSQIVGVAGNAVYGDLRQASKPMIYHPNGTGTLLTVRVAADPGALIATIRRALTAFDPNLEASLISAVSRDVERTLVRERLLSKLSIFFAALAACLAALGVYGLMSHAVASRTREIGIRMAIGAQRVTVLGSEMRSAMLPVAIGIGVGVTGAYGGSRLIVSQLFGVSAGDPAILAIAIVLLALVAAVAAYLPARRASRVDPTVALRYE